MHPSAQTWDDADRSFVCIATTDDEWSESIPGLTAAKFKLTYK
jgi:hypothetical protein